MRLRALVMLSLFAVIAGIGLTALQVSADAADTPQPATVEGAWTGLWGPYSPAAGKALEKENCKLLECVVVKDGDGWSATFEGECGRPYKYQITMTGRQVGDAVLFSGSADLGEADGGVFDWIGRATADEFVGFFTGARYTGVFHLTRQPDAVGDAMN